jgi:hypothetical protein
VNRLDQLVARSRREVEAHTNDLINTQTGRYFLLEAAHLLAALRLWSQRLHRSDQVVHEVLEAGDVTALRDVSAQLRGMGGREAKTASATVATMAILPSAQLQAIASYALRAM